MTKLKHYVYEYRDPRDNTPRYIGEGQGRRAYEHLNKAGNVELRAFISELRELGLKPIINIIEYFATKAEAWVREKELIAHYGRLIWSEGPLFNITEGGDGIVDPIFIERQKKAASATMNRLWRIPEYCEGQAEKARRQHMDPDFKKKSIETMQRLNSDPNFKELVRQGNSTPEHLDHLSRQRARPEFEERRLEGLRRIHSDLDFKKRRLEASLEGRRRKRQEKADKG